MKLDDLIRETRQDSPDPDWKAIDAKLFDRIEREPRPLTTADDEAARPQARVVWAGASLTLAAAAALLLFVHPSGLGGAIDSHAARVHAGAQLAHGDRIDVTESVAYFESKSPTVRWAAQQGSVLTVESPSAPLVLALEKGATEAQVTPVASGEAFAVDVTASSGAVVRVAVHGTHLRVARDGDKVTIDLTEGVVSIGAPPRRGSTIGTLVTAPAHVELDARDLGTVRVDHTLGAVRAADAVTPTPTPQAETAFVAPLNQVMTRPESSPELFGGLGSALLARPAVQAQSSQKLTTPSTLAGAPPVVETWLRSPDEVMNAIRACAHDAIAPSATFSTTLTMKIGDDGLVQSARFNPPLVPEARDCAANVIYKQTKLAGGEATIAIEVRR